MKIKPIVVFASLAAVIVVLLGVVTHDRWYPGLQSQIEAPQNTDIKINKPTLFTDAENAENKTGQNTQDNNMAGTNASSTAGDSTQASAAEQGEANTTTSGEDAANQQDDKQKTAEFDIVRIEPDGSAVVAGRAEANSKIALLLDGKTIGTGTANERGEWLVVPDKPIATGTHNLSIAINDEQPASDQPTVTVAVPDSARDESLVVMSTPNEPTKVLQKPTVNADAETAMKTKNSTETKLNINAVDYNDAGDIIFSGSAKPGETVRIYVDNKIIGDASVGSDGQWSYHGRNDIAVGKHDLRIDQLLSDGKVAERIALPFYRSNPTNVANQETTQMASSEDAEKPMQDQQTAAANAEITPAAANNAVTDATSGNSADNGTGENAAAVATAQVDTAANNTSEQATENAHKTSQIVVQPGNNLWNISRVIYGEGVRYTTIYNANKNQIKNPDLIYPGQILTTPGATKQ